MDLSGKHKHIAAFFGVALVATVLLAACGGATQSSPDIKPADLSSSAKDAPQATDFDLILYRGEEVAGGQKVRFSELLGQGRPVVLNLWAGLCPPCRLEMPEFQEVYDVFEDDILLLGLDVGPFTNLGTNEDGQALVRELGITYPTGTTTNGGIVADYQILGMPTTYFVTPDGEITRRWTGVLTEEKLAELVEELIEASAGS